MTSLSVFECELIAANMLYSCIFSNAVYYLPSYLVHLYMNVFSLSPTDVVMKLLYGQRYRSEQYRSRIPVSKVSTFIRTYLYNNTGQTLDQLLNYVFDCPIFYPKPSLTQGEMNEKRVLELFAQQTGFTIKRGLDIVNPHIPYLVTQSDGYVMNENGTVGAVIEIKSPKCLQNINVYDGVALGMVRSVQMFEGQYSLNPASDHYCQIQLSMALLNITNCYYILYSSYDDSILHIDVQRDDMYIYHKIQQIDFIFSNVIFPSKICKRYSF